MLKVLSGSKTLIERTVIYIKTKDKLCFRFSRYCIKSNASEEITRGKTQNSENA